jgi:hypothetical protein
MHTFTSVGLSPDKGGGASTTGKHSQSVRQSSLVAQLTKQIQPPSRAAQEEPFGHMPELPHETVQTLPGNRGPV